MRRIFVSDCEGPISKNDNAFELTKNFIPQGAKLFTLLSKYDDVLADVLKKPGYDAGSTLKLILPFLKAFDVTEKKIEQFSTKNLFLLPHSKVTLDCIKKLSPAFIVSTSYEQYIKVLCSALEFPFENTYCTKLSIDKYALSDEVKKNLRKIAYELSELPPITIPQSARILDDFSLETQKIIKRLDNLFWNKNPNSCQPPFFFDVIPIGGTQKAEAIKDITQKMNASIENVIYFGDSITDIEAFKLVRNNGGLAVSFNGNQYAVKNAEVIVLSKNNLVIAIITNLFYRFGTKKTIQLLKNWSKKALRETGLNKDVLSFFLNVYSEKLPMVKILTSQNTNLLVDESNNFRKSVRGEAVGRLG